MVEPEGIPYIRDLVTVDAGQSINNQDLETRASSERPVACKQMQTAVWRVRRIVYLQHEDEASCGAAVIAAGLWDMLSQRC